ncbi:MAG: TetR/AcrR family transcriptional regulator [Solirubrobacteraceae bacterium]
MAALRADAQRSIERILDAAVEELALDPEASMAAVARRAGVVRATVYVHFPTREALVGAVTERAMAEAAGAVRAAEPDRGDPADALRRVLEAAWHVLARHHALVPITTRRESEEVRRLHGPVLGLLQPLLRRGQADGAFNDSVPVEWLLTVVLELVHAASREVSAGRMTDQEAERALLATVSGALGAPTPTARAGTS